MRQHGIELIETFLSMPLEQLSSLEGLTDGDIESIKSILEENVEIIEDSFSDLQKNISDDMDEAEETEESEENEDFLKRNLIRKLKKSQKKAMMNQMLRNMNARNAAAVLQ